MHTPETASPVLSRSKSRLVRKKSSDCCSVPAGFFSVIRTITVDFVIPNFPTVTVTCVGNHTVRQIKYALLVSNDCFWLFFAIKRTRRIRDELQFTCCCNKIKLSNLNLLSTSSFIDFNFSWPFRYISSALIICVVPRSFVIGDFGKNKSKRVYDSFCKQKVDVF